MSSEWNRHKVYDIIDLISGGTPKTSVPEYWGGNIPWLSVAAFNTGYRWVNKADKTITERGVSESSTIVLEKGDLIISARGTVGALAQLTKPMAFNQSCYGIRGKQGISDVDFLYYALGEAVTELKQVAHGGVFDTITRETFKIIELNLPPLSEQRAIAQLLGVLDKRIALFRETNSTLKGIAQALFKSWFVDFDPVRAKQEGREPEGMDADTAALFPDSFEDSELGLIPKGWRVGTLGENTTINRGISPKYIEQGGVLVINQKCIRDYILDVSKAKRHDPTQRKIDSRKLIIGDVLVNSTGVGTLGRVAQVLSLDEVTIVDSHVTVVRTGDSLTWNYLGLSMMRRQAEIESLGEGTTGQTELSRGNLAALSLIIPPKSVLDAFDDASLHLRDRFILNLKQAKTLETLRDTLLPRLISGQLRLPEAETLMEAVSS
ncbi:MAG: restriction endonuclease subunit S [Chlorobiales bacterium]|nr:restriction endonuclease subunit S [Chlorobiales bacterium]